MGLRERCKAAVQKIRDTAYISSFGSLRFKSDIEEQTDDILSFVIAEAGRSAEESFENMLPLCLYFETEEDREEFVTLWHSVHPNAKARSV